MPIEAEMSVGFSQAVSILKADKWMFSYLYDEYENNLKENKDWTLTKVITSLSENSFAIELVSGKKIMRLNFGGMLSFLQRPALGWMNPDAISLDILLRYGLNTSLIDTGHRVTIGYYNNRANVIKVASFERSAVS